MATVAVRILVIGKPSGATDQILKRLERRGWGSRYAETLREAREAMETFHFDVVLSLETLSDGQGYEVVNGVARQSGTLLVGVALSESLLWLPVIEKGSRVLGKRALNAGTLESEIAMLLTSAASEQIYQRARGARAGNESLLVQGAELRRRNKKSANRV